jgi:hypothetical protein
MERVERGDFDDADESSINWEIRLSLNGVAGINDQDASDELRKSWRSKGAPSWQWREWLAKPDSSPPVDRRPPWGNDQSREATPEEALGLWRKWWFGEIQEPWHKWYWKQMAEPAQGAVTQQDDSEAGAEERGKQKEVGPPQR